MPKEKIVYLRNALELSDELKQRKVIIYGIGNGAERLCKKLEKKSIEPLLYCVTKRNDILKYKGRDVIEVSELNKYEDCAVLISAINRKYRREMRRELEGFKGDVYLELNYILDPPMAREVNFMQHIDLAIKKRKKIYIYGQRGGLSQLIEEVLCIYNVKVNGYVNETADEEFGIQSIYELAYDGVDDKLVIINEDLPERYSNTAYVRNTSIDIDEEIPKRFLRARENVELAGFSIEKDNYTSLQWYEMSSEYFLLNLIHDYDPMVGFTLDYKDSITGWKIYGKEKDNCVRVLVLGGSTSSEILHPENWVSKLYYKMKYAGINAVIYNGAHGDNDIVDELLRLLRDANVLKPDIVISMSGVNNLHYKDSQNQFNSKAMCFLMRGWAPNGKYCSGLYNNESLYSFWVRHIRLMKVIAEFYGSKFFGFMQPNNLTKLNKSLREKSLFEVEDDIEGARTYGEFVSDSDDYINLMHLFENKEGMYTSVCHYTDKANEILADIVWKVIRPEIESIDVTCI